MITKPPAVKAPSPIVEEEEEQQPESGSEAGEEPAGSGRSGEWSPRSRATPPAPEEPPTVEVIIQEATEIRDEEPEKAELEATKEITVRSRS